MEKFDKMRIWFAACIPESSCGGVVRSMRELASGLSRRGHECRIVDCGTVPENYLHFAARLALLFALGITKRPDWIIGRSTDAVLCAVISRLLHLKTRVALHSHGWEEKAYDVEKRLPLAMISPKTTWKSRVLRFPLLRLTLACCDVCLCGTIEEARSLQSRYPRHSSKIVCIPNGVTVRDRQFWPWTPGAPIRFLSVGNMTWKKNMKHTVRIFQAVRKTIPSAELAIVGCKPQDLVQMTGSVDKSGITAVSGEDPGRMADWYGTYPFFISSSLYEGGRSLAVLEAMSFGCVVFVSPIPSSMEFVKDRHNGIHLRSLSAEEDAAIVVTAVRSPALCTAVGRRAFLFASRHSWDRQAGRMEKVLCSKRP
jgi:glycosyltransferase involved in cell wall biosynthesis